MMKMLSGVAALLLGAWMVALEVRAAPSGFTERTIFEGKRMTELCFTSDERMFVIQKFGVVSVRQPGVNYQYEEMKNVLDIVEIVCYQNERGLGGLALHPNFDSNGWVYLYYTYPKFGNCDNENAESGPVNRLSRWTWDSALNEIDPDSEVVFLDTPPATESMHNSGKIEFGKDGMLYVTIGDQGINQRGQELDSIIGGMVRLTDQGDIPTDNPFANDANGVRCNKNGRGDGKCKELYAVGLRNPFRFSMNPNTEGNKVHFFINDVGAARWEEINEGGDDFEDIVYNLGLQNFGWPEREGPCKRGKRGGCDDYEGYMHPIHYYQHQDGGGAAVASTFVPNGVWGGQYDNKYFFSDYSLDKVYTFDLDEGTDCAECSPPDSGKDPVIFTEYERVVNLKFGPYIGGQTALYFTSHANGGLMRQVICDECSSDTVVAPPTASPTAAPTAYTPPVRPDGEGGYPGVLFPWSSGSDCPEGYNYCGVLEFCMGDTNSETESVYGYRLPCPAGETCECNGIPGPLIRLVSGNTYKLTLRNDGTEVTNLHTHGLHIVGDGDGDDVTRKVNEGYCLDYTWDIKWDHPGGTYWYHAHLHTLSRKQVGGGAFGMLIVEDNTNINPEMTLPSWSKNERLMQVSVNDYTNEMVANGRSNEVIDIDASQWYRFRVSMVSADAIPYEFTFADQGTCDIHKVASDGIWHSTVPGPKSSVWMLTGASRADFAVRCNTPNTLVPITYRNDELIAQVWVGSEEMNPFLMKEWTPARPYSIWDMKSEKVPEPNKLAVRLGYDYVNDGKWDESVPLANIAYNQVHEWVLLSTGSHPFHVHLYHMQVVTTGGCGPGHEEGQFYDTISEPDDKNCTVRFRTADIGQRCVLHCHVLSHEDNGSMSWVNVTGDGMPINSVQSPEYVCPAYFTNASPPLPPSPPPPVSSGTCPQVLLLVTEEVQSGSSVTKPGTGAYFYQEKNGRFHVRKGSEDNPRELIFKSDADESEGDYFSKLQIDGNLITRSMNDYLRGGPSDVWKSGPGPSRGDYFLALDCGEETVSIYKGTPNNPGEITWTSPMGFMVPFDASALDFTGYVDSQPYTHNGDCFGGPVDATHITDPICIRRGNHCAVGWTFPGEELHYKFRADSSEKVKIRLRAASADDGRKFSAWIEGVDNSGKDFFIRPNGGWDMYEDYVSIVDDIPAGHHTLIVHFNDGYVNLCSVTVMIVE